MLWTARTAFYRTHQKVMKAAAKVIPFPTPGLLAGPGSLKQLADNVSVRGLKKVLVVTDEGLMGLELPKPLLESLDERGIEYSVFDGVEPDPTIETVEEGARIYRSQGCEGIIAIGGGSPIDCAKIIGARIGNPFLSVRRMKGLFRVVMPVPPFFCVPTTAGTGSEATIVGVITDAATHEKFAIKDLKLMPKIAVLDAELMTGLPPHITAATGMDALTHAVEAFISLNSTPFTDESSKRAARLIFENLEEAYDNGSNIEARHNMALASYYAGAAFTRAYVGYVHAIAHNIGGLYGVPHGLANAIILPHVLRFSRTEAEPKLASLAVAAGIGKRDEPDEALASKLIDRIEQLNERLKIPATVAELREEDIPLIVERALEEAHPEYPVPRIMRPRDCQEIVRGLLPPPGSEVRAAESA